MRISFKSCSSDKQFSITELSLKLIFFKVCCFLTLAIMITAMLSSPNFFSTAC